MTAHEDLTMLVEKQRTFRRAVTHGSRVGDALSRVCFVESLLEPALLTRSSLPPPPHLDITVPYARP